MKKGSIYDVDFMTGRYEFGYERSVKCIKITPKSYRVERKDGTTRLIKQDLVVKLKEIIDS